jgi:hypothetical protein
MPFRGRRLATPLHCRRYAWLVNPLLQTVEVWRLVSPRWSLVGTYTGGARVSAEPFDAVELPLGALWAE